MSYSWAYTGGPPALNGAAGATTLVEGSSFCLSGPNGDIRSGDPQGLFFRDTRHLSRWELRIDGDTPQPLSTIVREPFAASFICRVPPRPGRADSTLLVLRDRYVGDGMREDIVVRNVGGETAGCSIAILLDADFADLFEVKENRATTHPERVTASDDAGGTNLDYRWMGQSRGVRVTTDGRATHSSRVITFTAVVPPREEWRTTLFVQPSVEGVRMEPRYAVDVDLQQSEPARRLREWRERGPLVGTPHDGLQLTLHQSELDLGALRMFDPDHPAEAVVAAGAPWFMALFGRDSLLTSWMALPIDPRLALGTLQTLARHQGTVVDPLTEEEPGRILHEMRFGVQAALSLGGGSVYYGTADATPLFVMLLGELRRWGAATDEVDSLLSHADRALDWIEKYGDRDGDGYVEYKRATDRGLANQGWKDSWDAVAFASGRSAEPPIALAEVQGYVYAAYLARAHLANESGDPATGQRWAQRARLLKEAFNRDFWLADRGYYAMALDRDKQPVDALASNMGHCLWTGIVDEDKAPQVVAHLMSRELFSGWGVRTLATTMASYNPMSYHNGSVWPHDNAIIAAGLMRYGFADEAQRVAMALLDAAASLGGRLPELFCGFDRDEFTRPVRYPTSCSPQAWAAATPIHLLRTLLRFDPALHEQRVRLAPVVPRQLLPMVISRFRVAGVPVRLDVRADEWTLDGLPSHIELLREPRRAASALAG